MTDKTNEIATLLGECDAEEKQAVFDLLKSECAVHPLEREWHASAEMILDAIAESADLTQRGVRGVIADRSFHRLAVPKLAENGWVSSPVPPDLPYDADMTKDDQRVTVQVKMQRRERGVPKVGMAGGEEVYVVEVQKTRNGKGGDGEATRPYAFGQFDILAVSLYASENDWSRYIYTPAKWLRPRKSDARLIDIMQPVPKQANDLWTYDFQECVDRLNSGEAKENPGFDRATRKKAVDAQSELLV